MPLSADALAAMMAEHTDVCPIILLTITHPSLSVPIRVTDNGVDVTSRGDLYRAFPFEFVPPSQGGGQPVSAKLRIDNVDRSIAVAVRGAGTTPPLVKCELVLSQSLNTVEALLFELQIRSVDIDALTVSCELGRNDPAKEPCPMIRFTPGAFPGLH